MILEDGRALPRAGDDDEWDDPRSKFERPADGAGAFLRCACGSETFKVGFPQFVCTTAVCVGCGREEIVHTG